MDKIFKKALLTSVALLSLATTVCAAETKELIASSETRCSIDDGFQIVKFPNGSVYKGSFKDCRPLEGPAFFRYQDVIIKGDAKPLSKDTVLLTSSVENMAVTVTMAIVTRSSN